MEHLLTLVENSEPQVIDQEKLKFFTTKISIWDHFSMHEASYKCLVLGLYKTIGYLVVRRDYNRHFLNYWFCEEKTLKFCILTTKRRIPNSFAGTLFHRHCLLFKPGKLQTKFSNLYYFLPSITDRSEPINQNLNSVNLTLIDIPGCI